MDSGVYAITNMLTGEQYLGASAHVESRLRAHRSALSIGHHPNKALQASWNRYGSFAFSFELLESRPVSELKEAEEAQLKARWECRHSHEFNAHDRSNRSSRWFVVRENVPQVHELSGPEGTFVTVERAASMIGVIDSRVRQLVRAGEIEAIAVQQVLLISRESIDRYVEAHKRDTVHPGRPRKSP